MARELDQPAPLAPSVRSALCPRRLKGGLPWIGWQTGYWYLLPALAVYLVFALLPIADTARASFTQWDGLNPPVFVGLDNYTGMFNDPNFWQALGHNLYFIVFSTVLPIGIALSVTSLLTRRRLPGMTLFQTVLFLPQIIPITVVGVMWSWMLNPAFGPVNEVLRGLGLSSLARPWLGDFDLARPVIGLIVTWMTYGLCLVLFLAGVQRIDGDLYDAAEMDGANEFRQFLVVTLPGIRNEIGVAIVVTLISTFKLFGLIFVTTNGGPGKETVVIALQLYQVAFIQSQVGYGSAIAVVLTALIVGISTVVLWLQRWITGD
jgi:raffinose/stachyose/melibiose transport system permease protein